MLGRVCRHLCTEERVPVDLTCCDSGIHLLFLLSVDLHHHSNVSGCYSYCYYRFSYSASHRSCKSVFENISAYLWCRSVVLIGEWAFYYSGLLDVTVPSSVTFLGPVILTLGMTTFKWTYLNLLFVCQYAFYNSPALGSAFMPTSLVAIAAYTFSSCSQLTSIIIPT